MQLRKDALLGAQGLPDLVQRVREPLPVAQRALAAILFHLPQLAVCCAVIHRLRRRRRQHDSHRHLIQRRALLHSSTLRSGVASVDTHAAHAQHSTAPMHLAQQHSTTLPPRTPHVR
jgi:hypothetical protein